MFSPKAPYKKIAYQPLKPYTQPKRRREKLYQLIASEAFTN